MYKLSMGSEKVDIDISVNGEMVNLWISDDVDCLDINLNKVRVIALRDWLNEFLGESK